MEKIVFAGPSIFGLALEELDGLDVRPPAACGDLLAAALEGPRQIALIDGIFENAPSVWHKEILFALAEGIAVSGAASMGALRAAECAAFGMVGIGTIFEDYRSGRRTADADVAVTHAPAELGFQPLTEALVDVEATIQRLKAEMLISSAENQQFERVAAALHFSDRSWSAILHAIELPDERKTELRQVIKSRRQSQKREDARALLAELRTGTIRRPDNVINHRRLARTPFFENLKGEVMARSAAAGSG